MLIIFEIEHLFIASMNGEQFKVWHTNAGTYFNRWTQTGWQRFMSLPVMDKPTAKKMTITLILKLNGELTPDGAGLDPQPNGRPPA